jgi:signal recognition particle GTPase
MTQNGRQIKACIDESYKPLITPYQDPHDDCLHIVTNHVSHDRRTRIASIISSLTNQSSANTDAMDQEDLRLARIAIGLAQSRRKIVLGQQYDGFDQPISANEFSDDDLIHATEIIDGDFTVDDLRATITDMETLSQHITDLITHHEQSMRLPSPGEQPDIISEDDAMQSMTTSMMDFTKIMSRPTSAAYLYLLGDLMVRKGV